MKLMEMLWEVVIPVHVAVEGPQNMAYNWHCCSKPLLRNMLELPAYK